MSSVSGKHGELVDDLQEQIAELRDQVSALSKKLSRRGMVAYEGSREAAGDIYDEFAQRFRDTMPLLRKRTSAVEHAARDNPVIAAAVGLVVIGLVFSLLAVKRQIAAVPDLPSRDDRNPL